MVTHKNCFSIFCATPAPSFCFAVLGRLTAELQSAFQFPADLPQFGKIKNTSLTLGAFNFTDVEMAGIEPACTRCFFMSLRSVDDFLFLNGGAIKLSKHNVVDLICFNLQSKTSVNLFCNYCALILLAKRVGKNVAIAS